MIIAKREKDCGHLKHKISLEVSHNTASSLPTAGKIAFNESRDGQLLMQVLHSLKLIMGISPNKFKKKTITYLEL